MPPRPRLSFASILAMLILLGGCTSAPSRPARTLAELSSANVAPDKRGEALFFNGRLAVVVHLERVRVTPTPPPPDAGRGPGPSGPYRGEAVSPEEFQAARRGQTPPPGNQPPVRLRLQLANVGSVPIEIRITSFDSALGNFAVRPERLTIAPGETAGPDPMTSRLGVAGTEIPVTVGLSFEGVIETQTIILRANP